MASAEGATVETRFQDWLKGLGISSDEATVIKLPDHRIIIAIDFGTTNSGYAFVVKGNDTIRVNSNWGGRNSTYFKVPTCVLFDENMQFQKFGLDAQDKYARLEDDQANDWLYFERFKMELHSGKEPKKLSRNFKLKAANGKEVPALRVFSEVLKAIWANAHDSIQKATEHRADLKTTDILWVITVPSIWSNEANAFMREAAIQAELIKKEDENRMLFALEPEAASIFCTRLKKEEYADTPYAPKPQSHDLQIVIDAGGGTVDITVHEVSKFHELREVHQASGGPWGGHAINNALWDLLEDVFDAEIIQTFKATTPNAYIEQGHRIEAAKVKWGHDQSEGIRIGVEHSLITEQLNAGKTVESVVEAYCKRTGEDIRYKRGYLYIGADKTRQMFDETIDHIVNHMSALLHHEKVSQADVRRIYLVGGFAICEYLQHRIKDAFQKDRVKVFVPLDSSSIVVKGAVLFGKNPSAIKQRVSRFTYGARIGKKFREGTDPEGTKRLTSKGDTLCDERFYVFVRKGEVVTLGTVRKLLTVPQSNTQTVMPFSIYSSTREKVQYVTDDGCMQVGRMVITLPQAYDNLQDGRCEIAVCFGLTEIHALVVHHKTLDVVTDKIDFLTD